MDKKGIYILEIFKKKGPFAIIFEQLSSVLKALEIKSIKKKMILVFLILALIPLLAMRLVVYPKAQDALQASLIQNLQSGRRPHPKGLAEANGRVGLVKDE